MTEVSEPFNLCYEISSGAFVAQVPVDDELGHELAIDLAIETFANTGDVRIRVLDREARS